MTAASRQISIPGSFPTARPPATAQAAPTKLFPAWFGRPVAPAPEARRPETIRKEGAPDPAEAAEALDNGRDVILTGDDCRRRGALLRRRHLLRHGQRTLRGGSRASGAGAARCKGTADCTQGLHEGAWPRLLDPRDLQWVWYRNDRLRERFVSICATRDVQRLTWKPT